jgi:uncharacterized membrane protein (DUF485 family)
MPASDILKTGKFKKLVRRQRLVSVGLSLAVLLIYFGFILNIAFNKEGLSTKIGAHITLSLPIGIGIIVLAWIITGFYVYWANTRYDAAVSELKKQINELPSE